MHASAWPSDVEVLRLLLRAGASIASRNDVGETPLISFALNITSHKICKEGTNPRIEAFRELLDAGSDVNARDNQGRTALHVLARDRFSEKEGNSNKMKAASLLLARGIDISTLDGNGKTAVDLLQPGNPELAQLLKSRMQGLYGPEMYHYSSEIIDT